MARLENIIATSSNMYTIMRNGIVRSVLVR